jgi:hypothetical protein
MKAKKVKQPLKLSKEENEIIQESLNKIKTVLKSKKINIKNTIGLIATDEIENAAKQVEIRFAEEKLNVVMNMIAFD